MNYSPYHYNDAHSFSCHSFTHPESSEVFSNPFERYQLDNMDQCYMTNIYPRPPTHQYPHMHHSKSNILLKCDECPKLFCSPEYLAMHKQSKHPKKEIIYIQIPSPSSHFNSSYKHLPTLGYDKMPVISEVYCEICQRNFCNKYFLVKHRQTVHGKQDEPSDSSSTVDECLSSSDQQSVHSNTSISRKNWKCHICKQEYYSFKYLKNHLKKKHQNKNLNEQVQSNIPTVNKSVIDLKRHILVKLKKEWKKKYKEIIPISN